MTNQISKGQQTRYKLWVEDVTKTARNMGFTTAQVIVALTNMEEMNKLLHFSESEDFVNFYLSGETFLEQNV